MYYLKKHSYFENKFFYRIGLLMLSTILLFTCQPGYAIEISDSPMATQIQKAPPNIMFVIDNSGSMNWEVMVAGSNQGRWYSPVTNNLHTRILSDWVDIKAEWPSQWSEVNKIYYNQNVTYKPWPHPNSDIDRMPDADTTVPVRNPYDLINGNNAPATTNLTRVYYTLEPTMPPGVIIVDNEDPSGFTTTGTWSESSWNPEWRGSSLYTSSIGAATFTPTIPSEGNYDVYTWVNCRNNRDENAGITIVYDDPVLGITSQDFILNQRSSSNNVCETGVCGEWIPLGSYHFQAGNSGSVTISRHAGSNGGSTTADAVLFAPAGTPIQSDGHIDINYAHYFTGNWIDANGNGLVDSDSSGNSEIQHAYLVNFQGQDHCGGVAPPAAIRQVYEINDINFNGILDNVDELIPVSELPSSLRPKIYDEDGIETGDMDASTELQNFANWFSYYRTRDLSAKAAIGSVIDDADDVNVGFYSIHDHDDGITRQPVLKVKIPNEIDQTSTLLWHLYEMRAWGGTPLRRSLRNVGRYFDSTTNDDTHGLGNTSPYYDEEHGGACQHSFAIVMTDGFWNGSNPGVGNPDNANSVLPPYRGPDSETLADVAMYYYNRDLSSTLPNQLPTTECDNPEVLTMHQHMITFSVSFGLNGEINIDDMNSNNILDVEEDFDNDGTPDGLSYKNYPCFTEPNMPMPRTPTVDGWPTPSGNQPSTIDDLWHAAINGRGEFFSASNPEELVTALVAIFEMTKKFQASEAAFTIDGDIVSSNDDDENATIVFGPSYASATWTGEVKAMALDKDGNFKKNGDGSLFVKWRASEKLWDLVKGANEGGENHINRKIISMHDGTQNGITFRWNSLSANQKSYLEDNSDVLEYIRGRFDIGGFRNRKNDDPVMPNVLGDIVHSSPVISPSGNTVFVGANDGMLHAFDADTGVELFAYIPSLVFDHLAGLKETTFFHRFFVDATPALWPGVNNETLLVGGLGKGGKGYYALNITDEANFDVDSESTLASKIVKWEFPGSGVSDPDMGYSFSKPFIVKSNLNGKWVVIFGNGYNSTNGHAVLYIIDADTGVELAKLDTGIAGDNGLSTPALIDLNNDNKVDVVYAGDLKGNLWKFDLNGSSTAAWEVAFSGNALFKAIGPTANTQPITTKPAVMGHPLRHGLMVLFGTGKFYGEADRISTDTQSLYGIWDFSDSSHDDEYLGNILSRPATAGGGAGAGLSNLLNIKLLMQDTVFEDNISTNTTSAIDTYGEEGNGGKSKYFLRITSDYTANWAVDHSTPLPNPDPNADDQAHAGWFFDLPVAGERLLESPLIRQGILVAVTTIPDSSYCSGGGWSIVNEFDALDGSRPPKPTFDVTGEESGGENDGKVLVNESDRINLTALTGETDEDGETIWTAATGILIPSGGILHLSESSVVELPGTTPLLEKKVLSSSVGKIQEVIELAPRRGIAFWREH